MPEFHHVNLGVPPDGVDSEIRFLVDMLGYRPVATDERLQQMGARWYEADDGSQVHLSADPEHQPAARAHVAVAYGAGLGEVEDRLRAAEIDFQSRVTPGFPPTLMCRDPAGNLWELRGEEPVPSATA
jgi:catechol 2,3-dioxygenase-like lactoylglutathione lyase family enzyme